MLLVFAEEATQEIVYLLADAVIAISADRVYTNNWIFNPVAADRDRITRDWKLYIELKAQRNG